MKQITLKELKEICGCTSNNDFANLVSLLLSESAKLSESIGDQAATAYSTIQKRDSHRIYTKLSELGYYDDLEGVF